MKEQRKYLFEVSSVFDEAERAHAKSWVMKTHPRGKVITNVTEHVDQPFKRYLMLMEFPNDKEAKEWFDTHYKGF